MAFIKTLIIPKGQKPLTHFTLNMTSSALCTQKNREKNKRTKINEQETSIQEVKFSTLDDVNGSQSQD